MIIFFSFGEFSLSRFRLGEWSFEGVVCFFKFLILGFFVKGCKFKCKVDLLKRYGEIMCDEIFLF